jgi:hypothetical protein
VTAVTAGAWPATDPQLAFDFRSIPVKERQFAARRRERASGVRFPAYSGK